MLLRYSLGMDKPARAIEAAVRTVLDDTDKGGAGYRTADLGGQHKTKDVGDKVVEIVTATKNTQSSPCFRPGLVQIQQDGDDLVL